MYARLLRNARLQPHLIFHLHTHSNPLHVLWNLAKLVQPPFNDTFCLLSVKALTDTELGNRKRPWSFTQAAVEACIRPIIGHGSSGFIRRWIIHTHTHIYTERITGNLSYQYEALLTNMKLITHKQLLQQKSVLQVTRDNKQYCLVNAVNLKTWVGIFKRFFSRHLFLFCLRWVVGNSFTTPGSGSAYDRCLYELPSRRSVSHSMYCDLVGTWLKSLLVFVLASR